MTDEKKPTQSGAPNWNELRNTLSDPAHGWALQDWQNVAISLNLDYGKMKPDPLGWVREGENPKFTADSFPSEEVAQAFEKRLRDLRANRCGSGEQDLREFVVDADSFDWPIPGEMRSIGEADEEHLRIRELRETRRREAAAQRDARHGAGRRTLDEGAEEIARCVGERFRQIVLDRMESDAAKGLLRFYDPTDVVRHSISRTIRSWHHEAYVSDLNAWLERVEKDEPEIARHHFRFPVGAPTSAAADASPEISQASADEDLANAWKNAKGNPELRRQIAATMRARCSSDSDAARRLRADRKSIQRALGKASGGDGAAPQKSAAPAWPPVSGKPRKS